MLQFLGLIFGLVFWRQPLDQVGANNTNGCLYSMLTQLTFGFCFNVVIVGQTVLFVNLFVSK